MSPFLSYFTLRRLTEELQKALKRQRILDAFLTGPHDLYLNVGGSDHLHLSASPGRGRIAFSREPQQDERGRPYWIEKYLLNATIESVDQVPLERIVFLTLVKRDRLGGETRCRLIVEAMGHHSNVVLVAEPEGRVLDALRRVGGRMSRKRQVLPGKPYLPPPPLNRLHPTEVTSAALGEALDRQRDAPAEALLHTVAGLDLLAARELLHRAGIREGQAAPPGAIDRLQVALKALFEAPPFLEGAVELPASVDHRAEICVLALQHRAGEALRSFSSVSDAIEAVVQKEQQGQVLRAKRKKVEQTLNRYLTSMDTKIAKIEADLKDMEQADRYEKYGSLLMSNLHHVAPGATSATLSDLFNPEGPPVTIPLAPNRLPLENARDYLKRSRKAKKGAPILARRLEAARQDRARLQACLDRLETLIQEKDLIAFQEELENAGLIRSGQFRQKGQKGTPGGKNIHPRRYRTSDGWTVLVGRNNSENDRLTKASAKDDIFFHAQGCPGSHVILQRGGKPDTPPRTTLEEAASLAAYWSKARGSKTVPVNYTEVRHVQKPRNAPPGLVTIRNEKTLFVAPGEIKRADESA